MKTFYVNEKTWVMDRSRICIPKFNMNKYMAFYLIPIFEKNMYRFSYGLSANPDYIENILIKLPVDQEGNPNWQYMEEYIKSLPYSKYL